MGQNVYNEMTKPPKIIIKYHNRVIKIELKDLVSKCICKKKSASILDSLQTSGLDGNN